MCLWKRVRTYLFLAFGTTLVRQPHYAGGRCTDKLEEYTAVLGNRVSLDSIAGTYNGVLPPNLKQHSHKMLMVLIFGHGHSKKSRTSKKNQEELSKCLTVIY